MRALVVEDEKTPRELLRNFVPWAKHGFERVDVTRNGLEALEILEAGDVDLVLTDVRMPKMDGIELALKIRQRWPHSVLIFLSGFSDKEYLKTAIRVQAQDYLDKPIDLEQVGAAVARAAQSILEKKQRLEDFELDEKVLRGLSPLRRQAQAEALFSLGSRPADLERRFQTGPLRALLVSPGPNLEPSRQWRPAVLALINGDDSSFLSLVAAPFSGTSVAVACDQVLAADSAAFNGAVESLLDLIEGVDPACQPRIGVAAAVSEPALLPRALHEAERALADSFYRPTQRIFLGRPALGRALELPPETRARLRTFLEKKDYPSVLKALELLLGQSQTTRDEDHDRVRSVWLAAMELLLSHVPSWGLAEKGARLEKLRQEMALAWNLEGVAEAARDCFERLFLTPVSDLHVADRILKARTFIESQFADPDLTVDEIAQHVGLSESYFCTVFKQAQGTTVKDYVTQYRIDRAKAYLWEHEPAGLAELAAKVGFRDPNYFGTVFKRLTGTSPGVYRKKALG